MAFGDLDLGAAVDDDEDDNAPGAVLRHSKNTGRARERYAFLENSRRRINTPMDDSVVKCAGGVGRAWVISEKPDA